MIIRFLKLPLRLFGSVFKFFLTHLPGGPGVRLRYFYYRRRLKRCGKDVTIDVGVQIDGAEFISIGDNVHIDKYCILSTSGNIIGNINRRINPYFKGQEGEIILGDNIHVAQFSIIMGYGGVEIGSNSVLSSGVKIYSLTNTPYNLSNRSEIVSIMPYTQAYFICSPVVLEENVWLGLNSIVMPNVMVGRDSFAISNSLLMGSFDRNSYISGQPAVKIKERFPQNENL